MKTLDQRILIPAPPGVVWAYISDISNNPTWQADCQNVVFLSQRRTGPGVRWRYATSGGEYVVETTAWYQGFGYEYTFIDGAPFKHSQGRLRLQEIAEGTVVQWTFVYDAGGPLGAFRDLLGLQRRLDNEMVESLKTLWKRITKAGAAGTGFEAKSLMRDAPDAEQRSNYKPRYPTAITEPVPSVLQTKPVPPLLPMTPPVPPAPPIVPQTASLSSTEPPIAEDDTRPHPAGESQPSAPPSPYAPPNFAPTTSAEPDFLSEPRIDTRPFSRSEINPPEREPVADEDIFKRPAASLYTPPTDKPSTSAETRYTERYTPPPPPLPLSDRPKRETPDYAFDDLGDDINDIPFKLAPEAPEPSTPPAPSTVETWSMPAPITSEALAADQPKTDDTTPTVEIENAPETLVIEEVASTSARIAEPETVSGDTSPTSAAHAEKPPQTAAPDSVRSTQEAFKIIVPEPSQPDDQAQFEAEVEDFFAEESSDALDVPPIEAAPEALPMPKAPVIEAPIQPEPPTLEPLREDDDETPSSPLDEPFVRDTRDASAVTIWDVFGIPRPSEDAPQTPANDGALKTFAELPAGPPLINPLAPPRQSAMHGGLRAVLRRRLVKLRHR